jgi:hypothetical protein
MLRQVKGVSASEAAGLMRWPRSYVLVDVRRADQFAAFHASGARSRPLRTRAPEGKLTGRSACAGSRSAPLYRLIDTKGGSPMQLLRALAFQAQNVDAVEDSPDFETELRAATSGAGGVILADAEGGSLEVTPQRPYGQVSRSLFAAYALLNSGYKGSVVHLNGGACSAISALLRVVPRVLPACADLRRRVCCRPERVVCGGAGGRGGGGGVGAERAHALIRARRAAAANQAVRHGVEEDEYAQHNISTTPAPSGAAAPHIMTSLAINPSRHR